MLKKDDKNKQLVYYQARAFSPFFLLCCRMFCPQAGIGTYTSPEIATPFMARLAQVCFFIFATPSYC
jgi:hypothetical protein